MEEPRKRDLNYAKLTLELHLKVKFKNALSVHKAEYTGCVIGKDLDEVLYVDSQVKNGILSQLAKQFGIKESEKLNIVKHEVIYYQGYTTYKI